MDTLSGSIAIVASGLSSIVLAAVLLVVVGRARKCLDFASTMYFYHFVVVCIFSGFPRSWLWWIFMAIGVAVTTVLGEIICLKRELREIPVGSPA